MEYFDNLVVNHVVFDEKWYMHCNLSRHLHIVVRHSHMATEYALLYRHTFRLFQPHKLTDAERFNVEHPNPDKLAGISDKLRYYRHKKALKQREVADYAGIYRSTYIHYENGMKTYPLDNLKKIAELLEIDIVDLLDDYHLFLWQGQGKQLKALRQKERLTQKEVAITLSVDIKTVKRWEREEATMPRKVWQILFSDS